MYRIYVTNTRFQLSFTTSYPCKQTNNIIPTWCKMQDCWQPMQRAAMCNRIELVQNEQVGCYPCHFDLKLTIHSSGLPTSLRYLLPQDFPLRFIIIISSSWQQWIMAPRAPQQGESGTESSSTMAVSSDTQPAETQLQRRHHLAHHDAANAATKNLTLHTQFKIVRKTTIRKNTKQHAIGCMCSRVEVHGRQ